MRTLGLGILIAGILFSHAAQAACTAPETGSDKAPALSPPLAQIVTGNGRLQFYSAPSSRCSMKGVFVIPKDQLIAYAQTRDGWTSVMYLSPAGDDVTGWVRSARLKTTGTIGPKQ
ncbi:hypothetical protein [Methylocella sp. CPCC 101449]|uniref:hypothetical protein n=1 Tax=Methylocella sp. CPCC 101449 TaxID=2987531 RepID=UPI0028914654|nr:hypothetical protein [Methylocella sp. CPCC 101449]MDT2020836.1 hypothetical protein [Methylocella sp. CPCC 101449]